MKSYLILIDAGLTFLVRDYKNGGYFCDASTVNFAVIGDEGSVLIVEWISHFSQLAKCDCPTPFLVAPKMLWCQEVAVRINDGLL